MRHYRFGPVYAVSLILLSTACSTSQSQVGSERVGTEPGKSSGYIAGAGGVRLFYRVEGSAPDTVVVLHGGPGLNLEGLRPDLRPLTPRHTLLYLDQRGSGRSEMPDTLRLTAELMVEDLEAVRRTLSLERLTLLGHSWGAGLAVLYAARYPGRVGLMVLVGPIPPRLHPYMDQYIAGQEARRDSAESARSAVLDSLWATAPDPYPPCRESTRIFLRGVAATPEAADRIKGDLCAGTPENIDRRAWCCAESGSRSCPASPKAISPISATTGGRWQSGSRLPPWWCTGPATRCRLPGARSGCGRSPERNWW